MTTVDLGQTFAKKIGMRSTAKKIFKDLQGCDEATLDFKGVIFISRSFGQEYVHQKRVSDVEINEINKCDFVMDLLDVVEKEYENEFLSQNG